MIRQRFLDLIHDQLTIHPICGLVGPRQVGKTTLAKQYAERYFKGDAVFFDLERPRDEQRLQDPFITISETTEKLIVIDEIQRKPELFQALRVLADEQEKKRSFLILGSASPTMLKKSSEALTGRIGSIELYPLSLWEVPDISKLWVRGGFPRSYLADNDDQSFRWREDYLRTFLEQDIPNLGFSIPPAQLRRFWNMLAFYHGQTFNASAIGYSLGLSDNTVRRYLDILSGTYMIRILTPWHENISKRQLKTPKIYFKDSGLLHALIGIEQKKQLLLDPRLGAFWEGFALEEIIRTFQAAPEECYYWGTSGDGELDLLLVKRGKRLGFEFKYGDNPKTTKSMHNALKDLSLDHLAVIYPGEDIYPLSDKITAYGLQSIATGAFKEKFPRSNFLQ